ncbi:MAG: AmpG family muropeptide MFS transporter [Elusimicrobia bacterium]|nr:AmpG family muropeptide MFS transporter [Elusimicrobiota bacterium]
MTTQKSATHPWWYVPTLYFAEGLPYIIVNAVSVILYKRMGVDNAAIAFWTSWLYLPWVIKMFWGPLVDMYSTKRRWVLWTQFTMAACLAALAFSLHLPGYFFISMAAFTVGAFISATHDIATDGYYMLALSEEDQAFFVGIRATCYRLAMIFGSGFLVYLAGRLETSTGSIPRSWMVVLAVPAGIFAVLFVYHKFVLPEPEDTGPRPARTAEDPSFWEVIRCYLDQDKIVPTLAFILLYRLGEAMLVKLASPFLLDGREVGGMGLTTAQVGLVYGTVGLSCLVAGGILGGWLLSRYGLKRCIWPMAVLLNAPDLFYVYMAYAQPPVAMAGALVALEQFGYGVGFTAFTVYLMQRAGESKYKTSHFAISTGVMALGMMLPGFVSGKLQMMVGYKLFFVIVCLATLPGMLVIPFIPKNHRA